MVGSGGLFLRFAAIFPLVMFRGAGRVRGGREGGGCVLVFAGLEVGPLRTWGLGAGCRPRFRTALQGRKGGGGNVRGGSVEEGHKGNSSIHSGMEGCSEIRFGLGANEWREWRKPWLLQLEERGLGSGGCVPTQKTFTRSHTAVCSAAHFRTILETCTCSLLTPTQQFR